eukprot:Gb_17942 [translate_table: standard]
MSRRGIEVDPVKVRAITEMPPRNLKQLRSVQGKIQAIRRFISQLADKCQPFTHLLKKDTVFHWNEECQQAFEQLKQYLLHPPTSPVPDKPLLLYISATQVALGALLAQHDDQQRERAIYYLSRTLVAYECNYTQIEKTYLAIVFTSQKLRHYMLNNKTRLIAKIDPLKYLLSKSTLTGRMAKWVMLLSEFDIEYVNQKAIKGQVLADHLAETTIRNRSLSIGFPDESILSLDESPEWTLYFDGSFTTHGSGVGIVFATPQGDLIPKAFPIGFPCTNNIAEYEALISSLKLAIQWNIQHLLVLGDSQLIIKQFNDEYQTKDEKLIPYKRMVDSLKQYFVQIQFERVPRVHNKSADAMATIGSLLEMQ